MVTGDLLVVKDATGGRSLIQFGKDAKKDPSIKEGDQVEVELSTDGQARSVTKLNSVR